MRRRAPAAAPVPGKAPRGCHPRGQRRSDGAAACADAAAGHGARRGRSTHQPLRLAGLAGGVAVVAAGAVAAGAYLSAGEPRNMRPPLLRCPATPGTPAPLTLLARTVPPSPARPGTARPPARRKTGWPTCDPRAGRVLTLRPWASAWCQPRRQCGAAIAPWCCGSPTAASGHHPGTALRNAPGRGAGCGRSHPAGLTCQSADGSPGRPRRVRCSRCCRQ